MRAGGKPHGADMAGDADCDFRGPHVGDRVARGLYPFARQVVRLRDARPFDHDQHGEFVRRMIAAGEPGIGRNAADAGLGGVEEIGGALDVGGAAREVVRHGRPLRRRLAVGEFGEQFPVVLGGPHRAAPRAPAPP